MTHPAFIIWFWRAVSRILSSPCDGVNHLSGQPIPGIRPLSRTWNGPLRDSLFGLAPDGVFRAASLTLRAVRSYRTFSPSPRFAPGLSIFCGTFRRKFCLPPACIALECDVKRLRGIAPSGVRTFLFWLTPKAILCPSKTKVMINETSSFLKENRRNSRSFFDFKSHALKKNRPRFAGPIRDYISVFLTPLWPFPVQACRGSPAGGARASGDAIYAAPLPQSGGCARG